MPYKIVKKGDKHCVMGPSGNHGCHDTRADAESQRRALYAAESASARSSVATVVDVETLDESDAVLVSINVPAGLLTSGETTDADFEALGRMVAQVADEMAFDTREEPAIEDSPNPVMNLLRSTAAPRQQ